MTKKMIDVEKLVESLRNAGMVAGYSPCGDSTYGIVTFSDGSQVWAYIDVEPVVTKNTRPVRDVLSEDMAAVSRRLASMSDNG